MPFGVSKDFLNLAKKQQRQALLQLAPLVAAALVGGAVAELLDPSRLGRFVVTYAITLAAGLIAGGLLGWIEIRSWAESLKDGWQDWMHSAVGAGSMAETAERAGAMRITIGRVAAAVLVVLNAACLIAAWFTLPPFAVTEPYGLFAILTVGLTGLGVGSATMKSLVEAWWCREVEHQTLDLVESGRVGVWGYR